MHEWVEKLLIVQEKDLRIAKLEEQLRRAPADRQKIEHMLEEAREQVAADKERLQEKEKAIKHLEMEADGIREKMVDFQTKSTMIKNNDEYKAAMAQIASCQQEIEGIEDNELQLMEEMEGCRETMLASQKELEAAETRAKEMLGDLDTRVKNCEVRLEKLRGERAPALKDVDPRMAQRYERLRARDQKRGSEARVLVPIREDVCDRCHMNVIAQIRMNARKGQCVSCENCGALLFWED